MNEGTQKQRKAKLSEGQGHIDTAATMGIPSPIPYRQQASKEECDDVEEEAQNEVEPYLLFFVRV